MKNRYFDARRAPDPRPAAAALSYDPVGSDPPRVVAAGQGVVAENIVAVARKHGIPLQEDAGLAQALARLEIAAVIPPELYAVVAEVLAFVYAVDADTPAR